MAKMKKRNLPTVDGRPGKLAPLAEPPTSLDDKTKQIREQAFDTNPILLEQKVKEQQRIQMQVRQRELERQQRYQERKDRMSRDIRKEVFQQK